MLPIWDRATRATSGQVRAFLQRRSIPSVWERSFRRPVASRRTCCPSVSAGQSRGGDLRRELKEQVAACLERSPGALPAGCRRYFRLTRKQAIATAGLGSCFYLDLPGLSPAFKTCRPHWVKSTGQASRGQRSTGSTLQRRLGSCRTPSDVISPVVIRFARVWANSGYQAVIQRGTARCGVAPRCPLCDVISEKASP